MGLGLGYLREGISVLSNYRHIRPTFSRNIDFRVKRLFPVSGYFGSFSPMPPVKCVMN